jgi:hypothetical protein
VLTDIAPFNSILERVVKGIGIATLIFRYLSSTSTEQIFPDSAGPFTSFDPVGYAIFATSLGLAAISDDPSGLSR